ncbi:MAG: hypothetical protein ACXW07_03885 [Nitrososphaeraceae archaeon]
MFVKCVGKVFIGKENILKESNYVHYVMKNSKTMQNIAVSLSWRATN